MHIAPLLVAPQLRRQRRQRLLLCLGGIALLLSAGCAGTPLKAPTAAVAAPSSADPSAEPDPSAAAKPAAPAAGKKKSSISDKFAKSFEDAVIRGDTAWRDGNADMAVYLYLQALSFRPRDINTLCKLGWIEQTQGNLTLAARAFELAANANPDDARVTARLGLIYLAQGDGDSASTWLQRSAEAASSDWRVYDGLGVLEQHHGDNAAALRHLQQAVALAPGVPTPLLHRAQALFASGNYAEAETTVRTVLNYDKEPEALRLLGQIQAKRRAYSEAIESLLQVLDPPAAYDAVAKSAMDNGDNAVAVRYFEQAAVLSPVYFAEAHHDAAIARERLGSSTR
jgi:tetratricopeptide (TPR) repeat protein